MAQYTKEEIVDILVKAGVPNKDIPIMVAIALAESMGDPEAIGDEDKVNNKWNESIGLFQIRSLKNPNDPKFNKADKLRIKDKLFDPVYNAKVAYEISKKGKTWTDWSTFNEGTYKKFMNVGPNRSNIRLAGGGGGRSKPIAMTDTQNNETDIETYGRPLPYAAALNKADPEIKKLLKLKKETENTYNQIKKGYEIGDYTKEELDSVKQELDNVNQELNTRTEKARASLMPQEISSLDSAKNRLTELTAKQEKYQKAFDTKESILEVAGRATTKKRVTRDMLEQVKNEVADAQRSLMEETPTPKNSAYKDPATTTNFDGSPKPVIPKGRGDTVYLGDVESFKQISLPSLGEKIETATMAVSTGVNLPQDLETLKRMWFNTDPKAQALVKRFKDIYTARGLTASQKDWESALNDTAGVNQDNPNQTLWQTVENMINGGAGGTGTGPSAKELKNKKEAIKLIATELGVELTDGQVNSLGYEYANGNIDATTVKSRIAATGNINFATGEAAKTIDSLKTTAAAYGVSYDPSWYNQSAKDILTGKVDNDTIAQQLKELAKSRYPSLAKQIDSGFTVKQIASPYLQSMANILEINPNDITMEDPTIKQAFTSLNADGQPSTKALWQFEQDLKQDPRWRFTKNAQTDLMGTARKVLQDFGLVS